MELTLLSGRSNPFLGRSIAEALDTKLGASTIESFPDDEIHIRIRQNLQSHDVYLIQSIAPPVARNLLELLLLADAAMRAGAARLTAVIPYLGYARQDRRAEGNEPVSARLLADLLTTRVHRVIALDVHNPALEGFFSVPMEHLTAVPLLAAAVQDHRKEPSVVVAPDLGAVKLAHRYARQLDLPTAYVHKIRMSGKDVKALQIIGNVQDRFPVVVDDMISTGGTMVSAVEKLLEMECRPEVTLVATHGLLVGDAIQRLKDLPIRHVYVTDSIHRDQIPSLPVGQISLGDLLAGAIHRLHTL